MNLLDDHTHRKFNTLQKQYLVAKVWFTKKQLNRQMCRSIAMSVNLNPEVVLKTFKKNRIRYTQLVGCAKISTVEGLFNDPHHALPDITPLIVASAGPYVSMP